LWNQLKLLDVATMIYNAGLGFSCFHVLAVNVLLLPPEVRPGWGMRIGLALGGVFFSLLSTVAVLKMLGHV
jgi:hypothetical protein